MESGQTRFPKPNLENFCCASIVQGIITGKEDHYYILSLRTLLFACILFFAWPGILLSAAAIINAKKAQKLDIEGNKSEAERKAFLAKNLNIASYITSGVYFIVISTVFPVVLYNGIRLYVRIRS